MPGYAAGSMSRRLFSVLWSWPGSRAWLFSLWMHSLRYRWERFSYVWVRLVHLERHYKSSSLAFFKRSTNHASCTRLSEFCPAQVSRCPGIPLYVPNVVMWYPCTSLSSIDRYACRLSSLAGFIPPLLILEPCLPWMTCKTIVEHHHEEIAYLIVSRLVLHCMAWS